MTYTCSWRIRCVITLAYLFYYTMYFLSYLFPGDTTVTGADTSLAVPPQLSGTSQPSSTTLQSQQQYKVSVCHREVDVLSSDILNRLLIDGMYYRLACSRVSHDALFHNSHAVMIA